MQRESLPTYAIEIAAAREEAADDLEVYSGLEIDYVPGLIGPDRSVFPEATLDIVIGSVHFVDNDDGEHLPIDGSVDEFADSLNRGMRGDIRAIVGGYYSAVRAMLASYQPDILGHIDVIRKNNGKNRFFDPSESWYRNEVIATIDAAAKNGCIVEVNTGGLARGRDVLYPEAWVVEALRKKNVRMMVNSDAHAPKHLGLGHDAAFSLLKKSGYTEQWIYTGGQWLGKPLPV